MGKAKNFKFCTHIHIDRNKSPLKISAKVAKRTLENFQGRASIYTAHRAVIFAIAQLSCFSPQNGKCALCYCLLCTTLC